MTEFIVKEFGGVQPYGWVLSTAAGMKHREFLPVWDDDKTTPLAVDCDIVNHVPKYSFNGTGDMQKDCYGRGSDRTRRVLF
jgi:hypothetical protein